MILADVSEVALGIAIAVVVGLGLICLLSVLIKEFL